MVLQCNAGEHVDNFNTRYRNKQGSKKMEFEVSSSSESFENLFYFSNFRLYASITIYLY